MKPWTSRRSCQQTAGVFLETTKQINSWKLLIDHVVFINTGNVHLQNNSGWSCLVAVGVCDNPSVFWQALHDCAKHSVFVTSLQCLWQTLGDCDNSSMIVSSPWCLWQAICVCDKLYLFMTNSQWLWQSCKDCDNPSFCDIPSMIMILRLLQSLSDCDKALPGLSWHWADVAVCNEVAITQTRDDACLTMHTYKFSVLRLLKEKAEDMTARVGSEGVCQCVVPVPCPASRLLLTISCLNYWYDCLKVRSLKCWFGVVNWCGGWPGSVNIPPEGRKLGACRRAPQIFSRNT